MPNPHPCSYTWSFAVHSVISINIRHLGEMKCKRWTSLKMTRMEMTASLTDKNHHACENRKWYQFQLSSTQPVSDFEMHSTFEEPLSPDKELSTLWFYRYWIFSVVYSSSKGRLPELTINREIWIVIIPKNSISYLSDPSDLLITKNRNISFNLIQNALHLCETNLTKLSTLYNQIQSR